MGFKVKPKHMLKFAVKAAPIAVLVAETAFPQVKAVKVATTVVKVLL
ncbi:hypothetical protein LEP3755_13440 [Leptolyngbya sp. NIES-3755]|nr:hypothetical protein LEP3755_13440 [Leptolyngbya sp. NIES-3755]